MLPFARLRLSRIALAIGCTLPAAAAAQVVTDGTLGAAQALAGPHYAIGAALGRQVGANLFHSFSQFSVATGGSATFSGPAGVANILTRVTGGAASSIDGVLRSTIAGANLYLINPSGILFGPNASLDLTGSFHATTADYVRLSDGGRFDATNPGASVLTSAPPAAFGFLGPSAGAITVQGSRLEVPPGQTISLVGGDVTFDGATLRTQGGDTRIVGIAGAGEVAHDADSRPANGMPLGALSMLNGSAIVADAAPGLAPGRVVIRGGVLALEFSSITSTNTEAAAAGAIELVASDSIRLGFSDLTSETSGSGAGAAIFVSAGTTISGFSVLVSRSTGDGRGGDIRLSAPDIEAPAISARAIGAGDGGDIDLTGDRIRVDFVTLSSTTTGAGLGGAIRITASERVSGAATLGTTTEGSGAGGDIVVTAPVISIADGEISSTATGTAGGGRIELTGGTIEACCIIGSSTAGPGAAGNVLVSGGDVTLAGSSDFVSRALGSYSQGAGNAGSTRVIGTGSARIGLPVRMTAYASGHAGAFEVDAPTVVFDAGTLVESRTLDAGNGGAIRITGTDITLEPGAAMRSAAEPGATGRAGGITLTATGSLTVPGGATLGATPTLLSANAGTGGADPIALAASTMQLGPGPVVAGRTTGSGAGAAVSLTGSIIVLDAAQVSTSITADGAAGGIVVAADRLRLDRGSSVETSAAVGSTGASGAITMNVSESVTLTGTPATGLPALIATRARGVAAGGDIAITTPLVTLDGGIVQTIGNPGAAGQITINAGQLVTANGGGVAQNAQGRVVLDGTLGPALALVGPEFDIAAGLGTQVGANLFHSFAQFSLLDGERATFSGPVDVTHVFGRVTGGDVSAIDGVLRTTIPGAHLWLVNPRGVLFGANARLDLTGSLSVTSADHVRLASDGRFDAAYPGASVLTGSAPAAYGFAGPGAGTITVARSQLQTTAGGIDLVGGNLDVSGARIAVRGGDLRLVSVAGAAEVPAAGGARPYANAAQGTVTIAGTELASTSDGALPAGRILLDGDVVALSAASRVVSETAGDVAGEAVSLTGRRVEVDATSRLETRSMASATARGADIVLQATERIDLAGRVLSASDGPGRGGDVVLRSGGDIVVSGRVNSRPDAQGDGGSVTLEAPRIVHTGGIDTSSQGDGSAGAIRMIATESITVPDGLAVIESGAGGGPSRGGDILLQAPDIVIGSGAQVNSRTSSAGDSGKIDLRGARILTRDADISSENVFGDGAAGRITLAATERVDVTTTPDASFTSIRSRTGGAGRGGDIDISAPTVVIGSGATIDASSGGFFGGGGRAGDIRIAGDRVDILGTVTSSTFTTGAAGSILVTGGTLEVRGTIESFTQYGGNAGGVTLDLARKVDIDGGVVSTRTEQPNPELDAPRGGSGGAIVVAAPEIVIRNRGRFETNTRDVGSRAGDIQLRGASVRIDEHSGLATFTENDADGGSVTIDAGTFVLAGGINASTTGLGNAGRVSVRAAGSIVIGGGSIATDTGLFAAGEPGGRAGDIVLRAPDIVLDGAVLSTEAGNTQGTAGDILLSGARIGIDATDVFSGTRGPGAGGNLRIEATETAAVGAGASFFGRTQGDGRGGSVTVLAPAIRIDGTVSTSTIGLDKSGAGGDIRIAGDTIGISGRVVSETTNAGRAGDISMSGRDVRIDRGLVSAASSGSGTAGSIDITATDALRIYGGKVATEAISSDGGNVAIKAGTLVHLRAGEITTAVGSGAGSGGNISIDPVFVILQDGSRIAANAFGGAGGNIDIVSQFFFLSPDSVLDASSQLGVSGRIQIFAPVNDVTGSLGLLPSQFVDVSGLLRASCATRVSGRASSFVGVGRGGLPVSPEQAASSVYFTDPGWQSAEAPWLVAAPGAPAPPSAASVLQGCRG